jgi:hypothetical protein
MAEKPKERIHYLRALFDKAVEELSFIEVMSESLGAFVIALLMKSRGLMDANSATADIVECVGCAILVPAIAFLMRFIFVAPAALVKESAKSTINPKSIYPAVISILCAICALLSLLLMFSVFRGESSVAVAKSPAPNFLFTQVDPPLEPPPPEPSKMPDTVSSQLESFSSPTNEPENLTEAVAQMKADKDAQRAQADWQQNLQEQITWTNSYPYFHKALVELHDQLHELSQVDFDGIVQPENYFDLPKSVDQSVGDFPLTHISLSKNTNVEFVVTISAWGWENKRQMIIACPAGQLAFSVNWARDFNGFLDIKSPPFHYPKCVHSKDADALMHYEINTLLKAQWAYSSKLSQITTKINDKSATKTVDTSE